MRERKKERKKKKMRVGYELENEQKKVKRRK
jgi:hypothetical protein